MKFKMTLAWIIQKYQWHNYNLYATYSINNMPNTKLPLGSKWWVFNNHHKIYPEEIPLHLIVTNY